MHTCRRSKDTQEWGYLIKYWSNMNPFFLYKMRWIKPKNHFTLMSLKNTVLSGQKGVRFYVHCTVYMSEVHTCRSQCKLCTVNDLVWSIRQECTAMPASSATCPEFPNYSWLYQEGFVNTEPQAVKGPIDFLMGYNNRTMLPSIN